MTNLQERIYDILTDLGTTEAIDMLLDYHGPQLLDSGLLDRLMDELELEE